MSERWMTLQVHQSMVEVHEGPHPDRALVFNVRLGLWAWLRILQGCLVHRAHVRVRFEYPGVMFRGAEEKESDTCYCGELITLDNPRCDCGESCATCCSYQDAVTEEIPTRHDAVGPHS